jgi:hypothetical protein
MAGKPAPECPNLSSAPGVLGLHAAQRHDGNWNFLGKRSYLVDRRVDAEYQWPPIGKGEDQCGHLQSETMQLSW